MKIRDFRGIARGPFRVVALALVLPAAAASAQAVPTASKSFSLTVFGGASYTQPDYTTENDYGFIIGGDITRAFRLFTASIEPRYGQTSGDFIGQKYFTGNLKLERALGHSDQFHPYVEAGVGIGRMHFGYPLEYNQTSKPMEAIIGGLDYDIKPTFGVKVEYQYQFWDFGVNSNGLNPHGANVAVYYRPTGFGFHRHR